MNKFYIEYPRNFANEYNVYIVSNFKEWRFLNLMGDKVKKITRKEAIEKGYYLPRRAKRDNIQFYGGFYKTMLNTDLVDSIYQCIAETENLMLYIEFQIDEANKKKRIL